jgi:protein-arginine kinase activator protein McsA
MKCDTCHFPATLQYTVFVTGKRCEVHLCERCAQKNDEIRKSRAEIERFRKKIRARIPVAKTAAPPAALD